MRDLCHVLMGEIWFYLQLLRILLKVQSISCSGAINEKPFNTKIRRKIGWFIDTSPKNVTNVMIYANYKMRFFGQLNSISKICLMDHSIRVPFYFGKVFVYFMPVSLYLSWKDTHSTFGATRMVSKSDSIGLLVMSVDYTLKTYDKHKNRMAQNTTRGGLCNLRLQICRLHSHENFNHRPCINS